ncbi:MAG: AAA family ATPase [Planctomycetota bacterium]
MEATSDAIAFFDDADNPRKRFRFDRRVFAASDLKAALSELFRGKCAFCESSLGGTSWDLEQFRPRSSVMTADGEILRPAYYWLAYDWSNLYPACPPCNRTKANRFPLSDESRRVRTHDESLEYEEPCRLLLDPCSDRPERYLTFDDKGVVASRWLRDERPEEFRDAHALGQLTIDVFGLNRAELVEARRKAAEELHRALDILDFAEPELYEPLLKPGLPFLGLRREMVVKRLVDLESKDVLFSLGLGDYDLENLERDDVFLEQEAREEERKRSSVESEDYDLYLQSSQISRIEIRNFGPIEHLDFDLGPGIDERSGWKVLLGENAVGKSSILKAVAATVMGEEHLHELDAIGYLKISNLLRRGAEDEPDDDKRCVRVYQATSSDPLTMTLNVDRTVSFNHGGLKAMLLGFGSARWLPGPGSLEPETGKFIRVKNLFNPFMPLVDALNWLIELRETNDADAFFNAESVLLRLLHEEEGRLEFTGGEVFLIRSGSSSERPLPLREFSDGYQTVLAMAVSIMAAMMQRRGGRRGWRDMAEAEGLVLIDEIGAHLHPRWKMRIVESLRDAFQRIQFIATSHEPLCLRGLYDREILVLHRTEDNEIRKFDDLPSVDRLSVDQLLTSRLFGLLSTLDLETERALQEYYELLALEDRSEEQRRRLEELSSTVGAGGPLGDSKRDQMIYKIADEYLAKRSVREQTAAPELSDRTKQRIEELWQQVSASPEDYL